MQVTRSRRFGPWVAFAISIVLLSVLSVPATAWQQQPLQLQPPTSSSCHSRRRGTGIRPLRQISPIPFCPSGATPRNSCRASLIATVWRFSSSSSGVSSPKGEVDRDDDPGGGGALLHSLRHSLRTWTGFSLTAIRAALRTATGLSFTVLYAATLAATGAWIRRITAVLVGVFPTWFRYFLQPFLVLYYVPLFVVRSWTGPSSATARRKHEAIVAQMKHDVEVADRATTGGLHVHVHGGILETDSSDVDLNEAIVEAVQISLDEQATAVASASSSSSGLDAELTV